jgi:glycosyltransferase involved in cell wall biosynthesis
VRVALINHGLYPYRPGVGGTWCHRLVRGLPEHAFHLAAITDRETAPVFYPPANTLTVTPIRTGGAAQGPARGRTALAHRRTATHAAVLLCRSMIEDTPHSLAMFRSALRRLAVAGASGTHPLHGVPLAAVLLDAWRAAETSAAAGGETPAALPRAGLPPADEYDAHLIAALLERAVRPLAAELPMTDLNHATDAGVAGLVAIAAKWRTGAPFLLTEHRPYLESPLLDGLGAVDTNRRPAVRAVLLRFLRALARLAYLEAARIVAPTEPMRRFALDHGVDRDKTSVVPYGVDPHNCPPLRGEPAEPVITWLGPESELPTMLAALSGVRESTGQPVRLVVAGPASPLTGLSGGSPAGESSIDSSTDTISFLGPVSHRRSAYATGQIVVLSGRDESMPYALIEAMMCGRPTVCLDDGGLAGMVGSDAITVRPGHPAALAAACATLLDSPDRRRELSAAAGQRARRLFNLRAVIDGYRDIYESAALDTAGPTEPMATVDGGRDELAELVALAAVGS